MRRINDNLFQNPPNAFQIPDLKNQNGKTRRYANRSRQVIFAGPTCLCILTHRKNYFLSWKKENLLRMQHHDFPYISALKLYVLS